MNNVKSIDWEKSPNWFQNRFQIKKSKHQNNKMNINELLHNLKNYRNTTKSTLLKSLTISVIKETTSEGKSELWLFVSGIIESLLMEGVSVLMEGLFVLMDGLSDDDGLILVKSELGISNPKSSNEEFVGHEHKGTIAVHDCPEHLIKMVSFAEENALGLKQTKKKSMPKTKLRFIFFIKFSEHSITHSFC